MRKDSRPNARNAIPNQNPPKTRSQMSRVAPGKKCVAAARISRRGLYCNADAGWWKSRDPVESPGSHGERREDHWWQRNEGFTRCQSQSPPLRGTRGAEILGAWGANFQAPGDANSHQFHGSVASFGRPSPGRRQPGSSPPFPDGAPMTPGRTLLEENVVNFANFNHTTCD